jgi:hypothetical protein
MKKNLSVFFAKISFVTSIFFFLIQCSAHTVPYAKTEWKEKGITSLEEIELGKVKHSVLIRGTDKVKSNYASHSRVRCADDAICSFDL